MNGNVDAESICKALRCRSTDPQVLHDESYDQDITTLFNLMETYGIPSNSVSPPPAPTAGPLAGQEFRDDYIEPVVHRLEKRHRELGTDHLPIDELLPELMKLFHRMKFRIERSILEPCEQARLKIVKLADRLNAA